DGARGRRTASRERRRARSRRAGLRGAALRAPPPRADGELRRAPGVRRTDAATRSPPPRPPARDPRPLQGRDDGRLRPALPPLDGTAPQGGPGARRLRPARRHAGPRARGSRGGLGLRDARGRAGSRRRGRAPGRRPARRPRRARGRRRARARARRRRREARADGREGADEDQVRPSAPEGDVTAPAGQAQTAVRITRRPDAGPEVLRARDPVTIVIFGASGDLARRKLIPALFRLQESSYLPERYAVVGFARTPMSDDQYRDSMRQALADADGGRAPVADSPLLQALHYSAGDAGDAASFTRLGERL